MFPFKSKTVAAKLWNTATAAARKITLEPAIILVAIMTGVQNGEIGESPRASARECPR